MTTNGNLFSYAVYSIYETNINDLSYTNQNTNGKQELTLLTCDNTNGNRLILKASRL